MLLNVNDDHVDGDETDDQKEEKPNDLPRPTHVANVEISPTVQTCFRTKFEEDPFLNHFDFYRYFVVFWFWTKIFNYVAKAVFDNLLRQIVMES